jgi:hypothetical protein
MAVDGSTLGERQEPVRIRRDIGREGTRRATTHRIRVPMRVGNRFHRRVVRHDLDCKDGRR